MREAMGWGNAQRLAKQNLADLARYFSAGSPLLPWPPAHRSRLAAAGTYGTPPLLVGSPLPPSPLSVTHTMTGGAQAASTIYDHLRQRHPVTPPPQGVPRDMIQLVSIAPSVQTAIEAGRGDVAAKSINDFFDLFVRGLTSGDTFALLTAEQQACPPALQPGDKPVATKPNPLNPVLLPDLPPTHMVANAHVSVYPSSPLRQLLLHTTYPFALPVLSCNPPPFSRSYM